jgi:hypothetical protein
LAGRSKYQPIKTEATASVPWRAACAALRRLTPGQTASLSSLAVLKAIFELWQRLRPRRTLHDTANPVRWLAAAMALAGLIVLHPMVIGLLAIW